MRTHTSDFKNDIKLMGRQLDSKITYQNQVIDGEQLFSVTPVLNTAILKSVMKELDFESSVEIPVESEINYKFGLLVNDNYEYIDYGNYIIYSSEYNEDTSSYNYVCYDKMLYFMKKYEALEITYPITIDNYIKAICDYAGLTFSNYQKNYVNADKIINEELFLDTDGNSLDYTFRDVLDQLAEVTASNIVINNNDEVEIKYINETQTNETTITDAVDGSISLNIKGNSYQETSPSPDYPQNIEVVDGYNMVNVNNVTLPMSGITTILDFGEDKTIEALNLSFIVKDAMFTNASSSALVDFLKNDGTHQYRLAGAYNMAINTLLNGTYARPEKNLTFRKINIYFVSGYSGFIQGTMSVQLTLGEELKPFIPYNNIGININGNNLLNLNGIVKGRLDNGIIGYEGNTTDLTIQKDNFSFTTNANYRGTVSDYIEIKTGQYIYFTWENVTNNIVIAVAYYDKYKGFISQVSSGYSITNGFRFSNTVTNSKYIRFYISLNTAGTTKIEKPTVSFGSEPLSYEQYFNDTYSIPLNNNFIGKLPNGVKDEITIDKNGNVSLLKKIGKVVLDGSETWYSNQSTSDFTRFHGSMLPYNCKTNNVGLSNYFIVRAETQKPALSFYVGSPTVYVWLENSIASTVEEFKTWLNTHNTEVYYELATPQTINLGKIEPIRIYEATNYIKVFSNLEADSITTTYSYLGDEIDEEYFKNINVKFGEKFGPVNTIVLSRSDDSDNIYYPDPLPTEPYELKIRDNIIMNFNDRADYLPQIYNQLYGLEFYKNDYTSTGIMYYEVLDRYIANINNKKYKCLMLNDEPKITQGLVEDIYTEMPEETSTQYEYANSDDRKINQAYIIANKVDATVEIVTRRQDDAENRINEVQTKQTATDLKIDIISTNINSTNGDIESVKTVNGFTFDAQGLNISNSESGYNAEHTNEGSFYRDGDSVLTQTTKDGTITKDLALYGKYYYGIDENLVIDENTNIIEEAMFLGQLYTDNNGEDCFGHFANL